MFQVIQVSEELLDSLQWGMKNKEESEQMIGPCFLKHADRMQAVYTEYCTNHENALALLTKVRSFPEQKVDVEISYFFRRCCFRNLEVAN